MRILVTGGLGTVGRQLVRELRARGNEVWLCDLHHHHDGQYVRCDVAEYRQLERVVGDRGTSTRLPPRRGVRPLERRGLLRAALADPTSIGTKNVLRLQEKSGFAWCSSAARRSTATGPASWSRTVMDEHEIRQMNDYAITKWVNELQVLQLGRDASAPSRCACGSSTPTARASTTAPIAP